MGLPHFIRVLFWLAVLALLVGLVRRAALWRQGQAAHWGTARLLLGLLHIPKRYFVDLHEVVAREPFIARAHVAAAGGGLATLVLVGINYGLGLFSTALDWALLATALLMLVGSGMAAYRRLQAPERLSRGPWQRMPYSLLALAASVLVLVLAGAQAAPWLAVLVCAGFALGAAELALGIGLGGPMKHAVAGMLHLGWHPRPERFVARTKTTDAVPATALKPLNTAAGQWGVTQPTDFEWNRLLSFDACVQCGKCEAACPAKAAGQPLNPKKLVQDLVVGMAGGSDAAYAGTPHPGQTVGQQQGGAQSALVPGLLLADTLWSCTTCRACVQACPMLIEHVDAVVDIRRGLTLNQGVVPNKGADALHNLRETDTIGGFPLAARNHWAVDLNLPVLGPRATGEQTDWLLLVGEGGFDTRYQRTLRALVKTLHKAGLKVALLGDAETDCGDLARRLGDELGFERLAKQLIGTLQDRQFQRIVTADPHVLHTVKNEYPALGGAFEVWHHTQLLDDLLQQGILQATAKPLPSTQEPVTYHDPCYLGRYNREVSAPRRSLQAIGIRVVEMERHGAQARCCGGGGGAPWTDIAGERRIPDIRMQDAQDAGARVVAVACPQCTAMLEGVVGSKPEVLDVAELVARAVEAV
ncbi:(Fe-S)-binding protein [Curvibacter sp. CHRR-16]|uniref:(Fe-S)-binding protein n=1 Tax=Curvibacter sp. CHRR-16 TaxID=2835872 RepID=UPI001BDA1F8C|nr:(Fe-S)-binding protein [Curvibacter sp. CHRR-16]MBT0570709.1 (Fe-S)-binding protein [Curvibacter sp. CHRR-16]